MTELPMSSSLTGLLNSWPNQLCFMLEGGSLSIPDEIRCSKGMPVKLRPAQIFMSVKLGKTSSCGPHKVLGQGNSVAEFCETQGH